MFVRACILGLLSLTPETAIAAAQYTGAAVKMDGSVVTWGDFAPPLGTLTPPMARIVAGEGFYIGIRPNGSLAATPGMASVLPSGEFLAVGAGQYHALAIRKPCYANCDQSTIPPVLNVNDFTCFINQYAAGCN